MHLQRSTFRRHAHSGSELYKTFPADLRRNQEEFNNTFETIEEKMIAAVAAVREKERMRAEEEEAAYLEENFGNVT